jgi:hypothetical protein
MLQIPQGMQQAYSLFQQQPSLVTQLHSPAYFSPTSPASGKP